MYDNTFQTYSRLECRDIERNIKKGAISVAEEQQKALNKKREYIEEQNTLKKNILYKICVRELIKGQKITRKQSSAISYIRMIANLDDLSLIQLKIGFRGGKKLYTYAISLKSALELYNADSMGKYYNKHIRGVKSDI